MGDRIYTRAEALKLLDALCANRTPTPWSVCDRELTDENDDVRAIRSADGDSVGHVWASAFDGDHDDIALAAAATLAAAAPDLAASVAHHAERADKAEAERDALRTAAASVLEAWKVTKAQCHEGQRRCRWCGVPLDEPHDDMCDLGDLAEREALAQLRRLVDERGGVSNG